MSALALALKSTLSRIRMTRYENPVVTKELRTRMRGYKAHSLMLGYVLLLGVIMILVYYSEWVSHNGVVSAQNWINTRLGFSLFTSLTWAQAILIALIAPSLTAGSLTLEREQQTMEMLSLTPLSARNIITGKLTSAMFFILMLLACSIPLAGICLMFGSISPLEIVITYIMLIAWALLFSSAGVLLSSISKKTSAAGSLCFGFIFFYGVFTTGWSAASFHAGGSNWNFVLAGLSACTAADFSLAFAPVFGVKLPVALVGITLMAASSILFLTTAMTRLPHHRVYKSALIRMLLLGISLVIMFLIFGNVTSAGSGIGGTTKDYIHTAFVSFLSIFTIFIPAFSTGPVTRSISLLKSFFTGHIWRKPFENNPVGGLWFLALWWIAGCAVILLCVSLISWGKAFDLVPALQASVALLAVVIGMGAVGILASTFCPNRQLAVLLVVLFIILAWIFFPFMMWQHESSYNYSWNNADGPIWQVAYFWPGLVFEQITDKWSPGTDGPILCLPKDMTWLGCVIAWGLVTIAALSLAQKRARKPGGIPEE